MTWLSEIEAENVGYRKVMRLSDNETTKERMARVIREQSEIVKLANSIDWEVAIEGLEDYPSTKQKLIRLWRLSGDDLSSDAKELINDCAAPSST